MSSMIGTPQELFAKLSRTFSRRADYKEDQLDWVFDFSVTAWHMTDWVAAARGESVKTIQDLARTVCPALGVCEQVCNGFKHYSLDNSRLKGFQVGKDVLVSTDRVGVSKPGRAGIDGFDVVLTPAVVVSDRDGRNWDALKLFRDVLRYWRDELGVAP